MVDLVLHLVPRVLIDTYLVMSYNVIQQQSAVFKMPLVREKVYIISFHLFLCFSGVLIAGKK